MSRVEGVTPAQLTAAMRQLTDDQRAIFLAIAQENASYATIAEQLGTTSAEVERLFAAALVTLDKEVERPMEASRSQRRLCFVRRNRRR